MAGSKSRSVALIILGLVVALFFLLADALGVGEGNAIGYKQMVGILVGAVILIYGVIRALKK